VKPQRNNCVASLDATLISSKFPPHFDPLGICEYFAIEKNFQKLFPLDGDNEQDAEKNGICSRVVVGNFLFFYS